MKMKNRVFKGAIGDLEAWDNGKVTDKFIQRYEKLSKMEIGTIITGGILVEINKDYNIPTMAKMNISQNLKKW